MSSVISGMWGDVLRPQFDLPYMGRLRDFLKQQKSLGKVIYPKSADCFHAFNFTSFESVRVVILGQDPYHQPNQAHGLSFSVPMGVGIPPSLKNIFKELESDLGVVPPLHGCLVDWALEGVLLLNSILSVEASQPGSHRNKGWEQFTDCAISVLSQRREGLVFILWGAYARSKRCLIDVGRHFIIESAHPSPLSAHNGFLGSCPFSKANQYLGDLSVDWALE